MKQNGFAKSILTERTLGDKEKQQKIPVISDLAGETSYGSIMRC
jgi:hypothetical protein